MTQKNNAPQLTYAAFISYRHTHPDINIAKYLHTLLETYPIPGPIAAKYGAKRFGKIFRDQEELPVSEDLSRDILNALQSSRFLIVICSPNTPQSKWCAREIELFKQMNGNARVLTLLIDGEPDISFPQALRSAAVAPENQKSKSTVLEEIEPLAADIRANNLRTMTKQLKKYEVLRLIAPMLGVSFDTLRQRERERGRKKAFRFAAVGMLLAASIGILVGLGLNRIEAEQERTKFAAKQAEAEHARAETLTVESELAKIKADAEIALQTQKVEIEKQKAEAEQQKAEAQSQRAIAEQQRAELEAQKAESERQRAEEQRLRADDLTTSAELTDLLVDAQGVLADGWRISAMQKAAKVIKGYSQNWGGYNLVQRSAQLLLQQAAIQPAFTSIGTITNSPNPGERTFFSYITKDETSLLCFNNYSKSFDLLDIQSGKLLRSTNIGSYISSMIVEEKKGLLIYVLSHSSSVGVMDLNTGKILYTAHPDSQYAEIFSQRATLCDIYRMKESDSYQFFVNKDGKSAFRLTFSLKTKSISVSEFIRVGRFDEASIENMVKYEKVGVSSRLTCMLKKTPDNLTGITVLDEHKAIVREFKLVTPIYEVSALVTADERYLVAWCGDFSESFVFVYDLRTKESDPLLTCPIDDAYCEISAVIPGQDTLVIKGEYKLNLLDPASGYKRTYVYDSEVDACSLSSSGNILAISCENKTTFMSCRPKTHFPIRHTTQETLKNSNYAVDVFSSSMEQRMAYSDDYYAIVGWLYRNYIEIYESSSDEPISRYISPGKISCFTLDPSRHRLYVYSWELGLIIVWDWDKKQILTELVTPCSLGAVSIQPCEEENKLYLANGFIIYQIDLNTHQVIKTIRLDEDRRSTLLSVTYIFDEDNDRVYVFSGDEQGSQILQTVYGVYQLSTGEKICGDIMPDSPLHKSWLIRYCLWRESGVALYRSDEEKLQVLDNVYIPPFQEILDAVPQ